jgi:hypothetical protein
MIIFSNFNGSRGLTLEPNVFDEATQLKNATMNLKYVSYNGTGDLNFEKNSQNCVDSLEINSNRIYFVQMKVSIIFFLIAQTTISTHKAYIAFGYSVSLSFQRKVNGNWTPLETLA